MLCEKTLTFKMAISELFLVYPDIQMVKVKGLKDKIWAVGGYSPEILSTERFLVEPSGVAKMLFVSW